MPNSDVIEVILDASQIEVFEDCPRKWFYDYVLNLTTKHPNPALSTGSFFHECLKFYYSRYSKNGKPLGDFIGETLRYGKDICLSDKWPEVRKEPKFFLDRLRSYLYHHLAEDEQMEVIAVEKGFSSLLYQDESRRYILEGMIDVVAIKKNLGLTVIDHKTQSRFYEKFEINHQVYNYLRFTQADYFEYNYIGLQDTQNANTFHRPIHKPAPGMLKQWESDVMDTFEQMYQYLKDIPGAIYQEQFPRRRAACTTQFGLCQFHKICSVPDDSGWTPVILSNYAEKDEKWRAWS